MKTQEINYNLGDQNFKAYVAHPELDKAPLILIAHTWAGKDDFVELKARELAEEGFIAMAVDMYGDGKVGSSTEENQSLMTPLVDDREKLKSVINAALQAGKELEGVDSSKIAAIGYCFGGVTNTSSISGTDFTELVFIFSAIDKCARCSYTVRKLLDLIAVSGFIVVGSGVSTDSDATSCNPLFFNDKASVRMFSSIEKFRFASACFDRVNSKSVC